MNAEPAAQLRLLDVQAEDTTLAQLAHRRSHLPELSAIATAEARSQELADDIIRAQTDVDDLVREQQRIDRDVEQVRTRAERDGQRMQVGAGPAKELASLQHEIETLARRQSVLEDAELEVMENREQAEGRLNALRADAEKVDAELAQLRERRDAAFAEIDRQVAAEQADRRQLAAGLPEALLNLYEKIRVQSGTGAAPLRQRRCEGCRIELSGNELTLVRNAAPDLVLRCEECRRILVRTAESGL
ncbi:MAG: zinc ribbon domain-containing protein [Mycobacteriales bacterium]|nr:MAG: hypothetical protein DLM56_02595 [Pseudonocardiales bacterium]